MLEATPARAPGGGRAVCQSAFEQHDQKAPPSQRAHVCEFAAVFEGTPLDRRVPPKTTESLHCNSTRRLTFDMSGGGQTAQLAGRRPLDGGVRFLRV